MERKLAAILVADVVGYSRLMQQDEAGTFERLRAHRKELFEPAIDKHQGHIFKLTGDGLLAEFGSVIDAVLCAVEMQLAMASCNDATERDRRIDVRIGIHVGDVIIDGEDRFGDVVNVAARLQQVAEPGGICCSRPVVENVTRKIAFDFESRGEVRLKNIADPVSLYRLKMDSLPASARPEAATSRQSYSWRIGAVAAITIVLAGGVVWSFYPHSSVAPSSLLSKHSEPNDAPTLAVLPFENLSNDPQMSYLADGVTETIITGLSRSPQIRVVARTSTETYVGKHVDVRQIGKDLSAGYVLEGSVQKSNDKLRIVAQLIDTGSGSHVWAEKFDREGEDPLTLEDEVTEKIVGSLAGDVGLIKKNEYDKAWSKDSTSMEEYVYYLRGHQLYEKFTKEDTLKAIEIWQEGLAAFPESSLLREKLAWGYYQIIYGGWSRDTNADYARAYQYAEQGVEQKHVPPLALLAKHWLMAFLLIEYKGDWDGALRERDQALALAPSDPLAITSLAEIAIRAGKPDEAISSLTRDLRWDTSTLFGSPYYKLGWAYLIKGDYSTALEYFNKEPNAHPLMTLPLVAATYVGLGKVAEARAIVATIRREDPSVSLQLLGQTFPYRDKTTLEHFLSALRVAGLPET